VIELDSGKKPGGLLGTLNAFFNDSFYKSGMFSYPLMEFFRERYSVRHEV
jgi:hypothetical protein